MTSFLAGALGAATVLFVGALARGAAWRHFSRRRAFGPRRLLRRIGATPDQERAVLAETDALAELVRALRRDAGGLRADLADLLAEPALDPARVASALDVRLARTSELRARLADGVARIHSALGPEQRARLAALVRNGPAHRCGRAHAHAA
jgi:uncharacterized membrane protein